VEEPGGGNWSASPRPGYRIQEVRLFNRANVVITYDTFSYSCSAIPDLAVCPLKQGPRRGSSLPSGQTGRFFVIRKLRRSGLLAFIGTVTQSGGVTMRVTTDPGLKMWPNWSPDEIKLRY